MRFGSIAVAAIMIDAACKQLEHRELLIPVTIAFVVLTVVVLASSAWALRIFAALASTLAGEWIMWPLWDRLTG